MNHINNICLSWLRHIFFKKTDKAYIQFLKYITLGNISNIFDFLSLYILTEFIGLHYVISASVSFIIGVLSNYLINILWIFKRGKHEFYIEIMLIIIVSTTGLILSIIVIYVLVEYLRIHYMLSKAM